MVLVFGSWLHQLEALAESKMVTESVGGVVGKTMGNVT